MSDTPETDAKYIDHPWDMHDYIPFEFARKLERERDEARAAIKTADAALRKCMNYIMTQPLYARNQANLDADASTLEAAHVAITKLQPHLK